MQRPPRGQPHVACDVEPRLAARLELHDLRRALPAMGAPAHRYEMAMHLVSFSVVRAPAAPSSQRAPRAKSEMSCGVAVSKPTTSSIPGSSGSAIEKPFETMPTTTSRASMPDARR